MDGLTSKFIHFLTLLLIRLEGCGKFSSKGCYSVEDCAETVYWYETDRAYFTSGLLGKNLLNGVIALNQTKLEGFSKQVQDYVFLHELGHKSVNKAWKFIFYPMITFATLGSVISFFLFLGVPIHAAMYQNLAVSILSIYLIFPWFLTFTVTFIGVKWVDEAFAERFAFKKLGRNRAKEVIDEVEPEERSFQGKILHRMLYPPRRVLLKLLTL